MRSPGRFLLFVAPTGVFLGGFPQTPSARSLLATRERRFRLCAGSAAAGTPATESRTGALLSDLSDKGEAGASISMRVAEFLQTGGGGVHRGGSEGNLLHERRHRGEQLGDQGYGWWVAGFVVRTPQRIERSRKRAATWQVRCTCSTEDDRKRHAGKVAPNVVGRYGTCFCHDCEQRNWDDQSRRFIVCRSPQKGSSFSYRCRPGCREN